MFLDFLFDSLSLKTNLQLMRSILLCYY